MAERYVQHLYLQSNGRRMYSLHQSAKNRLGLEKFWQQNETEHHRMSGEVYYHKRLLRLHLLERRPLELEVTDSSTNPIPACKNPVKKDDRMGVHDPRLRHQGEWQCSCHCSKALHFQPSIPFYPKSYLHTLIWLSWSI